MNNNYYCVADTVVITTVGGSGEKLQLYTGACGLENGGILLGTGTPLSIAAPTVETTVYARWESGCGVNNYLYSSCVDITIYQADPTSPPTSVTVDTNEFCDTWGGNITLTSAGGSGNELQWHIGSCFSGNIAGIGEVLTIPAPADTTTYYPGWINSCDSSCLPSITVNVKHTPEVPDYLVATPQQFCLGTVSDITIEAVGGFGDTLWIFKDIYFGPYPIGYTTTGSLTFPAPTETTTYVAGYSNPCGTSISTSITVTVFPSS